MKKIVTHAHCVDGFLSEHILRDTYPDAEFVSIAHGPDLAALEPCEGMLFCDICPPRAKWQAFVDAGVCVLDHHATARGYFDLGGEGVFASEAGVSGAGLALRHRELCTGKSLEADIALLELVRLVGLYDTWVENHRDFGLACEAHCGLDLIMRSSVRFMSLGHLMRQLASIGEACALMHAANLSRAEEIASDAMRVRVQTSDGPLNLALVDEGYIGTPVLNLVGDFLSETDLIVFSSFDKMKSMSDGAATAPGAAITFPPRLRVSLRSRRNRVDCSQIAARLGGGGHAGAAGFTSEPLSEVRTSDLAYIMLMSVLGNSRSE